MRSNSLEKFIHSNFKTVNFKSKLHRDLKHILTNSIKNTDCKQFIKSDKQPKDKKLELSKVNF